MKTENMIMVLIVLVFIGFVALLSKPNAEKFVFDFGYSDKALTNKEIKAILYPEIVAGWNTKKDWQVELNDVSDLFRLQCDFFYVVNNQEYEGSVTKLKIKEYIVLRTGASTTVYLKTGE